MPSNKIIKLKRTLKGLSNTTIRNTQLEFGEPLYLYSESDNRSYLVIGDGSHQVKDLPVFSAISGNLVDSKSLYYTVNSDGTIKLTDGTNDLTMDLSTYADKLSDMMPHATISSKGGVTHAIIKNTAISKANWVDQAQYGQLPDYSAFPYRYRIAITGCTENHRPEIIFDVNEATSGIFAPIAKTVAGAVYIYATELPDFNFTIPTIELTA